MKWRKATFSGWGRVCRARMAGCTPADPGEAAAALAQGDKRGLLAHGAGRSYGDVALNSGGRALLSRHMNRIVDFDPERAVVTCEPGVTFHDLLARFLPRGFLPLVTPGTGFATLGGAVANDVHGKNHHAVGSFGDHLRWLELVLPNGEQRRIAPDRDPELFAATIGGLGLTGYIARLAFPLQRVPSNAVALRERRITDLDAFLDALAEDTAPYSVGWIDALARGRQLGRGILETAAPSEVGVTGAPPRRVRVPMDGPGWLLNPLSVRLFNDFYYRRVPLEGRGRLLAWERFLYPLDAVLHWNRLYGRRGFYQFQCVLPDQTARAGLLDLLTAISGARAASFLAVLKRLGGPGRGLLSFPMAGYTLALDFPAKAHTRSLLAELEAVTLEHGGRVYLAKDATLSPAAFRAMYPNLPAFRAVLDRVDPERRMNSDLARRLALRPAPAAQRSYCRHLDMLPGTACSAP